MSIKHIISFLFILLLLISTSTLLVFKYITPTNKVFVSVAKTKNLDNPLIGIVQGKKIWKNDLNSNEKDEVFKAESEYYQSVQNIVSKKYFDLLIEKYMKEKKIDNFNDAKQKFLQDNVKVTDKEVVSFLDKNKSKFFKNSSPTSNEEQKKLAYQFVYTNKLNDYFSNMVIKGIKNKEIQIISANPPKPYRYSIKSNDGPFLGKNNAPITIVQYSDYQCPYCLATLSTIKEILEEYKDRVRFVYKDFPMKTIHPYSIDSAISGICAQKQNKFWEVHTYLFDNQNNINEKLLEDLPKATGLKHDEYQKCRNDPKTKSALLDQINNAAISLGITETPTFFINGIKLQGAQNKNEFIKLIELSSVE